MDTPATPHGILRTTAGDLPLHECRLSAGGRDVSVLHTGAVVAPAEEARYLAALTDRQPYGVVLWPAAIALAHEVTTRAGEFRGAAVLELGAGTGLPGIVAAAAGARVVQTDRHELALDLCRRNGERNGAVGVEYRLADWDAWDDPGRYDWVIGSDVLYADSLHPPVRRIFEANLAPGGRVLVADPFRAVSLLFLEGLEEAGWRVTMSKWTVGEGSAGRSIGVFELTPPAGAAR